MNQIISQEPALALAFLLCVMALCFAVPAVLWILLSYVRPTGVDINDVVLREDKGKATYYVIEKHGTICDSMASVGKGYSGSCFSKWDAAWLGGAGQIALSFIYPRAQMRRDVKKGKLKVIGSFASRQEALTYVKTQL